jgi:2-haloacid dehalogenase
MVLATLERASIETAALSNANDAEWTRLFPASSSGEFPSLQRLTYRFSSHELGMTKPDARAFAAVEQRTGFSGVSILFVDDRIENVTAARAYGWRAEPIDHTSDTASQLMSVLKQQGIITAET